jgi:hypothetical protein
MPTRVVHMIIAPTMLVFFTDQPAFFRGYGFNLEFVSPPGPGLVEFGQRERASIYALNMT